MKYLMSVLLTLLLTSCTQPVNPDEDFEKMYKSPITETNLQINNDTMSNFDQTTPPEQWEEIVVMETTKGTIKIRLFEDKAPKTVENFKGLIAKKYYDGIIFHRVIPDFMIQWGDPTWTWTGGESLWGGKFEDEFHSDLKNINGALSMANAWPWTNGSQFFIVTAEATPWLDWAHTVFGQVFEGMDVVNEIQNVERNSMDKPLEDIKMTSVVLSIQN